MNTARARIVAGKFPLRRAFNACTAPEASLKIMVVDDHPLIREGLRGILTHFDGEEVTVLEAGTAAAALQLAEQNPDLDLVLLDLHMPDMHGLEALGIFGERYLDLPVVVLSAAQDKHTVNAALQRGAAGFIPKSSLSEVLMSALRLVLAGGIYVPPEVLGRGTGGGEGMAAMPGSNPLSPEAAAATAAALGLTERQTEVLSLLVQGKSNKQICRELNLAEATVKVHVRAILRALNVGTRTQAVIAAGRLGMKVGS